MLRLLVAALLVANAVFYGWSQGLLDQVVGVCAQGDREPGRLALQVEPQRVRVVPMPNGSSGASSACLEIGPLSSPQLAMAEAAVEAALPQGRIEDVKTETPAIWIVFVGPYAEPDARQKMVDELKRLKLTFEDIRQVPELGDGLSLGRFDNRNAAEKAAADFAAKGVRTARVAQYTAAVVTHTLRVPDLTPLQQAQLKGLQTVGLAGKSFTDCTR